MDNLYLVYGIIGLISLCICGWLGVNKKLIPNKKVSTPGFLFFIVGAICLFISVSMAPNQNVNIDELSDQELYEYVMELDEDDMNEWFSLLTDRQQTRVFHVYMVNELEDASIKDAFE